mmetsp:Transcript_14726/g.25062  ORF Transcript_14726/g.25062 Transcript_14726/m.25062 type:complete len:103 (+) Transcript_14726:1303-1611(+)
MDKFGSEFIPYKPDDQIYLAGRLRIIFKRTREEGVFGTIGNILTYPFDQIRKITIPISDPEQWDKHRMAMMPLTLCFSFCFLFGIIGGALTYHTPEEKAAQR